MHVSPAKHSSASVTDGQTDRRTDGQTDKVIPMCRYAIIKRWNDVRPSYPLPTSSNAFNAVFHIHRKIMFLSDGILVCYFGFLRKVKVMITFLPILLIRSSSIFTIKSHFDYSYCKRGYFRWGKISRKCWQGISRGVIFTVLLLFPPVRTPGVEKTSSVSPACRKRRLIGAVCRNHRIKRVVPCRCWTGTLKNPAKCLWRWEPDRRYNFFFSPPADLSRHIWLKYRCIWRKTPINQTKPNSCFLQKGI